MKNDIDELLKIALTPTDVPDERLNNQVLTQIKEEKIMNNKKRIPAAAIIAATTLIFGSVTVFAAARHYLSPAEVAVEIEDDSLKDAFLSDDALTVNETQEYGNYRITLMGSVAGKNISDYLGFDGNGIAKDDRIYTVVAIEHTDGTPMPDTSSDDYGKESFCVSHYIHGLNPLDYSVITMGGGYTDFVRDGIQYRIMEMDNIEIFADKGIYVGVNSGTFFDNNAFVYDEQSGDITRNTDYEGVNALFKLPIDASKADPAAAEAYLKKLEDEMNAPDEPIEKNEIDLSIDAFMEKLTAENLDELAAPIESTRKIYTPDSDGIINYDYKLENGREGSGPITLDELSKDAYENINIKGYSYSSKGLKSLIIDVFILNEDGTVTYVLYQPKISD